MEAGEIETILGFPAVSGAPFAEVINAVPSLPPLIDKVFPLAQTREAYARLQKGEQQGKIVLEISK